MKFCYSLLTLASLCYCLNAVAVTYYVDAKNGNDGWSGTVASATATNGPWQSIARVNATLLLPGDNVLFSCGQTWYEPLMSHSDGTTAAKIYFGSYPSGCSDKPKISGFKSIQGFNWQPHQGNIWKTVFPQNLIENNSLSLSVTNWAKWPSDASQTFATTCPLSVAGCMNFLAGSTTNTSLAISNLFSVIGGQKYTGTVSFYAPSDTSVKLIVRENGNSYRTLGLSQKFIGNGQWQDVNVEFNATNSLANVRLDIEVPKTKRIYVRYANVQETGVLPNPSMVLFDNDPVTIAHHPNVGHDIDKPGSVYLRTTAASPTFKNTAGNTVSSKISIPDLKLPSGASVGPGTKLKLREINWYIGDHSVTSVGSGTLSIAPETTYPLTSAGWGFYFYDALWMLDSPGEWFFDSASQTLYLWTPTSENPGNSVKIAAVGTAIDLRSRLNLVVENLEIDGASTGVDISKSTNVTLQNLTVHNIDGNAILAVKSSGSIIESNHINRVGASGVTGVDAQFSSQAIIENNELTEAGIFVKAGKRISLPTTSRYGILGGLGTIIASNSLSDIGGTSILGQRDNDIDSNVIQRSCININDCGSIYVSNDSTGTVIRNNLILDSLGDLDGTPLAFGKHIIGIYLDMGVQGISVTGNTIKGSTHAIQLHNSGNNTISGNILYGSEQRLLWQNEDPQLAAILTGNIVSNNQFFPTVNNVSIFNTSESSDVFKFATYTDNHYSTIFSSTIASEKGLGFLSDYTFQQWQAAKTTSGIARNNDLDGGVPAPLPSFAQGTIGNNFIPNSDFSAGFAGWGSFNAVASSVSTMVEGCLPISVNCIRVSSNSPNTLIYSPKFAITKGKFYRVAFDIKASVNKAVLYPRVRFAGPKYDDLTQTDTYRPPNYLSSTEWERHSFVFQATATAADPAPGSQSARFDISGIPTGQTWIANLEMTPFDPGDFGPATSELLLNKTDINSTIDCPSRTQNPGLCSNYVNFPEGTVVTWPVSVSPRSGRIVFTQNLTLLDSDGDGIANSQDDCTATAKGLSVNGRGCSLLD